MNPLFNEWVRSETRRQFFKRGTNAVGMAALQSLSAVLVGQAFDTVIGGGGVAALTSAAIFVIVSYIGFGLFDLVNSMAIPIGHSSDKFV